MSEKNIKFITYDKSTEKFYPPVPLSKFVPEWYKNIPQSFDHNDSNIQQKGVPTIKKCVPVLDYLTGGYVILNPYEVNIRMQPDDQGVLKAASVCPAEDYISAHPYEQCPVPMNNVKNHYFKVSNSWKVVTPPGYSCHFYQPFYTLNSNYKLFPSIVDTDKHDDAVNFVGLGLKENFVIKAGEPLMVVFPFKRDSWSADTEYHDYRHENRYKYWIKKAWHGTYATFVHSKKKFR